MKYIMYYILGIHNIIYTSYIVDCVMVYRKKNFFNFYLCFYYYLSSSPLDKGYTMKIKKYWECVK